MNEIRISQDPAVVYDVMREAANRLVGIYAQRATVGGTDDPAIASISEIYDEVEVIDPNDLTAQEAATADFRARYVDLRETAARERKARDAVASARLEGTEISGEWLARLAAWVRGELTDEELLSSAAESPS